MKKYIISVGVGDAFNAASKARRDVETVALRMGYEPFVFEGGRAGDGSLRSAVRLAAEGFRHWRSLIRTAEPGSVVLVQYPHFPLKSARMVRAMIARGRVRKGLRFIALIHDLDSLRGAFGAAAVYSDRQLLPAFDTIICHNAAMRAFLAAQGIPERRLVTLEIFDYLTDTPLRPRGRLDGVAVAGNLDSEKGGYVDALSRLADERLPVHLYGKGREGGFPGGAAYHGAFSPEALPGTLEGAFGLVWDGPSADGCSGPTGTYLRYNDPHKLSLYLASGLPVLIWREAAAAPFVAKHGAGLSISSLGEIPGLLARLTDEEYTRMQKNALLLGRALRSADYTRQALEAAEAIAKQGGPR